MARRYRKKGRRSSKMTIPLSIAVPVGMVAYGVYNNLVVEKNPGKTCQALTGFNASTGDFYMPSIVATWGPVVAGGIIHKAAGYLGVNRMLSKVPLLRV